MGCRRFFCYLAEVALTTCSTCLGLRVVETTPDILVVGHMAALVRDLIESAKAGPDGDEGDIYVGSAK
jgi:hypothetical protein